MFHFCLFTETFKVQKHVPQYFGAIKLCIVSHILLNIKIDLFQVEIKMSEFSHYVSNNNVCHVYIESYKRINSGHRTHFALDIRLYTYKII